MSVLPAVVLGVVGILVGTAVDRAAARYPWSTPLSLAGVIGPGERAARPPVLEVVSAVGLALVGLRFGWAPELPVWAWFVAVGLLLAVIDLRLKLLPNRILLPAVVVALLLLVVAAAVDDAWSDLSRGVIGGVVSFVVGLALALISPGALGMGDVKLAGLLGLLLGWLGWPVLMLGFLLGFVLQALLGLALMAARRAGRSSELPFGPALLAGALAAVLLSGEWAGLDSLF